MKKLIIIPLLLLLLASRLLAQTGPAPALRAAAAEIEAATAALSAASDAQDRVGALADTIRSLESGLGSLRLALRASSEIGQEKRAAIAENRKKLGVLLATLSTLQNNAGALSLHPSGAVAAARTAMILAALTPELRLRAEALQAEMAEVDALFAAHNAALVNLQAALLTLQSARTELSQTIRENLPPPANPADSALNIEQLLRASDDLSGLAIQLGARVGRTPPPSAIPIIALKGKLKLPVEGLMTRNYNEPNAAGIRQPGIMITAPPLSLVIAPQAAIVRFAGDFMEYGQVVILEPAPRNLQIYAGFGQVYVSTGEVLESGAIMGLLGGETPDSAEFLAETGGEADKGAESLYIEIRENGSPVNPLTWFAEN